MTSVEINSLVQKIVHDKQTKEYLKAHSLVSELVTWEDTARTKGTSWGPNISDMTISVDFSDDEYDGTDMPVIRSCNFTDETYDVPIGNINLTVDTGGELVNVNLREYLENFNKFIGSSEICNLYDRDTTVITSAQCCVLPCKEGGKTEFCVRLFNYQTTFDNPAVLVIVATDSGTSAQVLDRKTTDIMFNNRGIAHNFAIERLTNVREQETEQQKVQSFTEMTPSEADKNVILIIQVPLVVPEENRRFEGMIGGSYLVSDTPLHGISENVKSTSGMDMGVISLGKEYGRFKGTRGLTLVRDTNFMIRLTKQYYRVTDTGYITEKDVIDIAKQLKQATIGTVTFGSLVVKTSRTTEPLLISANDTVLV